MKGVAWWDATGWEKQWRHFTAGRADRTRNVSDTARLHEQTGTHQVVQDEHCALRSLTSLHQSNQPLVFIVNPPAHTQWYQRRFYISKNCSTPVRSWTPVQTPFRICWTWTWGFFLPSPFSSPLTAGENILGNFDLLKKVLPCSKWIWFVNTNRLAAQIADLIYRSTLGKERDPLRQTDSHNIVNVDRVYSVNFSHGGIVLWLHRASYCHRWCLWSVT